MDRNSTITIRLCGGLRKFRGAAFSCAPLFAGSAPANEIWISPAGGFTGQPVGYWPASPDTPTRYAFAIPDKFTGYTSSSKIMMMQELRKFGNCGLSLADSEGASS